MNGGTATTRKREKVSVALLLLWGEGGQSLRREFGNDFTAFCRWADEEAEQLLRSALEKEADQ